MRMLCGLSRPSTSQAKETQANSATARRSYQSCVAGARPSVNPQVTVLQTQCTPYQQQQHDPHKCLQEQETKAETHFHYLLCLGVFLYLCFPASLIESSLERSAGPIVGVSRDSNSFLSASVSSPWNSALHNALPLCSKFLFHIFHGLLEALISGVKLHSLIQQSRPNQSSA